eukprot:gnl/MRDRNA2_/MRDRNA2_14480_c0_seq1.p1 gnl/MRDRNA2_/MRDRNA2_14480_c0~~gnl/MRDRNA2_/MRDRNA2_14480_c0_seq1.p1  ORF type:complete len:126 (+),score=32.34 gnl/MRDRNA2_/MRDRNA2_14480_c0_seq1:616-993(+)
MECGDAEMSERRENCKLEKDKQFSSPPEVVAVLERLQKSKGNLCVLLKPGHPSFDADLKGKWKKLSRESRRVIVEADRENMRSAAAAATVKVKYPFQVSSADHCETSLEAYQDIAPFLDLVAVRL